MPSAPADLTRPQTSNAAHDMVGLTALMERTEGADSVSVALIDGPLPAGVGALENDHIRGATQSAADRAGAGRAGAGRAGAHAVRVAGILMGTRSGTAPGICPGCTLLVHPVLEDGDAGSEPLATHEALADAIRAAVDARADIVNVSLGLRGRSAEGEQRVQDALDHALRRGVLVVAAAGNESRAGGSVLTRHPWVLPVAGFARDGTPVAGAHLGHSTGTRGLGAPAEDVLTLRRSGKPVHASGTSMASPIVAGTAALLWSSFPAVSAADVRRALLGSQAGRRSIVPPLLAAEAAYARLAAVA